MSKVQIGYGIPQLKPYLAVANLPRQYDVIMLESHMPLQEERGMLSCLQFAKDYSSRPSGY